MNDLSKPTAAYCFSQKLIEEEMQRIFADPIFAASDILKRFLQFVVEETFAGHSLTIKEYTIGVKVLNKPIDFRPQEDAIVRIHAGRLRRALNKYYKQNGLTDTIRISIPKGNYLPVFSDNSILQANDEAGRPDNGSMTCHQVVVGVLPFRHYEHQPSRVLFSKGFGEQLSTSLAQHNVSVIAHCTMLQFAEKNMDVREIASTINAQYIIAGNIQFQKSLVRVSIELIDAGSSEQIWSETYTHSFASANAFDIQDEMIQQVVASLVEFGFLSAHATKTTYTGESNDLNEDGSLQHHDITVPQLAAVLYGSKDGGQNANSWPAENDQALRKRAKEFIKASLHSEYTLNHFLESLHIDVLLEMERQLLGKKLQAV